MIVLYFPRSVEVYKSVLTKEQSMVFSPSSIRDIKKGMLNMGDMLKWK